MAKNPTFINIGRKTDSIDVRLSYKIVELFSEGLYASPNKAIEELVANSFDAGAQCVLLFLSQNLHDQDATIVVMDDGEGMNAAGLKQHWLIGASNKRSLAALPRSRQQIGKFGIGKLATYVLAGRLTHVTKFGGKYYSTSMNYSDIDSEPTKDIEGNAPIIIPLRTLNEQQAKEALQRWTTSSTFKKTSMRLFGKKSSASWTVTIMSALKPKVHEIKPGFLEWVLRTALPLRPDFNIWLNGKKLIPSKAEKGRLKTWTLGKNLIELPKPAPKDITPDENIGVGTNDDKRFGLIVPNLGRITGYAEAYKDLLTGKSDELGRSYGFFVYVFGRLVNVTDGHFGISPDELRHGTFGRFRLVVHMDGLDEELRSNRETISEGPLLETAKNTLRAIFNAVRSAIDKHDKDEDPSTKIARTLAASPSSLGRQPIISLTRSVLEGKVKSHYLIVPDHLSKEDKDLLISDLEERASDADNFITGLTIDYNGSALDGLARYDTANGILRINAWHPFVATFYDGFDSKAAGLPLKLLAMAEVLMEAHLHVIGMTIAHIEDFLSVRDQLLRYLANDSGRRTAFSIAIALRDAKNNPHDLEIQICAALESLGFAATHIGGSGKPDGVAHANLSAGADGIERRYKVSLEAKSKEKARTKVSAKSVGISTIARQRNDFDCDHALVVGPSFPTQKKGDESALAKEIADDREKSKLAGKPRTITLITVDDLANLVRLRPLKQIGLAKLKDLFAQCSLPEESGKWVNEIEKIKITKPPYKTIIETIADQQKKFHLAQVKYSALRVALSYATPPIEYETDEELKDLCKAMMQMAPGAVFTTYDSVELDQSAENVIAALDAAMDENSVE